MPKLYRWPALGLIRGVCVGIALRCSIPPLLIRTLAILLGLFGSWSLLFILYVVLAFTLDKVPASIAFQHFVGKCRKRER